MGNAMCCESEAISARNFKAPGVLGNRNPNSEESTPTFKLNKEIDFKKPAQDGSVPKEYFKATMTPVSE